MNVIFGLVLRFRFHFSLAGFDCFSSVGIDYRAETMVGQFVETFWRKSFIGDLRRAKKVFGDDSQWTIEHGGKTQRFEFVWLQGICVKVGHTVIDTFLSTFPHRENSARQGICVTLLSSDVSLSLQVDKAADSMTIEDATGQAELRTCSRIPDIWSTSEGMSPCRSQPSHGAKSRDSVS